MKKLIIDGHIASKKEITAYDLGIKKSNDDVLRILEECLRSDSIWNVKPINEFIRQFRKWLRGRKI